MNNLLSALSKYLSSVSSFSSHSMVIYAYLPHMNDSVVIQPDMIIENLLPHNVFMLRLIGSGSLRRIWRFFGNFIQQVNERLHVVFLQFGIILAVAHLFHERRDGRITLPAGKVHLITAQMKVTVGKHVQNFGEKFRQGVVGGIEDRIDRAECAVLGAVGVARGEQFGQGIAPGSRMAWNTMAITMKTTWRKKFFQVWTLFGSFLWKEGHARAKP